jgi:hypothetical protein
MSPKTPKEELVEEAPAEETTMPTEEASSEEVEIEEATDETVESEEAPAPAAKKPVSAAQKAFNAALALFVRATEDGKAAARLCANAAIQQFFDHGTLNMAQDFSDACERVGKNYIRHVAFVKWLAKYAPVTVINGRFKKDHTREAMTADDLKSALANPFWDSIPSPEKANFTEDDVVKSMSRWIASWNSKEPSNSKATKKVAAIAAVIGKLEAATG